VPRAATLPPPDARQDPALARARAPPPRLAHVTIAVLVTGHDREAVHVFCDGVETNEGPAVLDPGAHVLTVTMPGHATARSTVMLRPSEDRRIDLWPGVTLADAPPLARSSTVRTAAWITLGLGVVSVATGSYFGVRALESRAASDADCSRGICRDASGVRAYDDAKTFSQSADVAFAIGGLAGAVSAALFLVGDSSTAKPRALGAF